MERLPPELSFKIFCFLDHKNLATAQQVCRKWKELASDNILWYNLFKERWSENHAAFYSPHHLKMWKDVYAIQDRCDRFGLGLKVIREGNEYYLVQQGEIQRHLGSRKPGKGFNSYDSKKREFLREDSLEEPCLGIVNRILFFIGDLEVATRDAKRNRIL